MSFVRKNTPLSLTLVLVSLALVAIPAGAQTLPSLTLPVNYGAAPIATASFFEDHGSWHAGIDFPQNATPTLVNGVQNATVNTVWTHNNGANPHALGATGPTTVAAEASTISGPWQFTVSTATTMYMLDILSVRRVTTGKPVISYTVASPVETTAGTGYCSGVVNLVMNTPSAGDALVAGTDSLSVSYAFYNGEIRQVNARMPAGGGAPVSFDWYAHIDNVQTYVSWNTYPATAQNRFYSTSGAPAGRSAHVLSTSGATMNWSEVLQSTASGWGYGTEDDHVHYTLTLNATAFPGDAANPFNGGFTNNDPQGNRPVSRSFGLVLSPTLITGPALRNGNPLYGDVEVFLEAVDNMGGTEIQPDRDTNAIREAGVYNAGYWITPFDPATTPYGSVAAPRYIFMSTAGLDTTPTPTVNALGLLPNALFRVDVNTNYHTWVSHTNEDPTRLWRTNADVSDTTSPPDGSQKATTIFNEDALWPDAVYRFGGVARDLVGRGAPRDSMVTVDNFRPFVKKVEITQDGLPLYSGEWNQNAGPTGYDLAPAALSDRQIAAAIANTPIVFKVQISETVAADTSGTFAGSIAWAPPGGGDTLQIRFDAATALRFDPQGGGATTGQDLVAVQIDSLDTTLFQYDTIYGSATIPDPGGTGLPTWDGDAVLVVDIEDLATDGTGPAAGGAGNRLLALDFIDFAPANQINPSTSLTRNAMGVMQGTAGQDKVHKFQIDTQPPEIEITVEGGT